MRGTLRILVLAAVIVALGGASASADESPLHPEFPLLDAEGRNVLEGEGPVSPMATCGNCHDTGFIADHSSHADAGLADLGETGLVPWDLGSGWFGAWDPVTYRYLNPPGETVDLGTPEWLARFGVRHAGGGPAELARDGFTRLADLVADPADPETAIVDPETGEAAGWDWSSSGTVELDCFVCHLPDASIETRRSALESGRFGYAAQGTLCGTGILHHDGDECRWDPFAFGSDGEALGIVPTSPSSEACGQCHGIVHMGDEPLLPRAYDPLLDRTSLMTGEVFSPQRIIDSGINHRGKEDLTRTWDAHAERLVECVDCHHAENNPVFFREGEDSRPEHLVFDGRRLDLGDYLLRPSHRLADVDCSTCHDAQRVHDWLPYRSRHLDGLACETCHIPTVLAPAASVVDWTLPDASGEARIEWRGVDGEPGTAASLVTGYTPALLAGEGERVRPGNLVASWYWVSGDPARPVRLVDLQAALLVDGGYRPEVIEALDEDGDGLLLGGERVLEPGPDVETIAGLLEAAGIVGPRIVGEVRFHELHHGVATGEWATRECSTCHGGGRALEDPFFLGVAAPGDVLPEALGDAAAGRVSADERGLWFDPAAGTGDLYVFGSDRVVWIDVLGVLAFVLVLGSIGAHGALRWRARLERGIPTGRMERVYMYGVYERLWHWVQTAVIGILLLTGLVIHAPGAFGIFAFDGVVAVHNVMAAVLVVNAGLAAFYHLASGEIRQFLPRPRGFFDRAAAQAVYYMRGIFRGEPHPFAKDRRRKLNPLQQITYFGILNVLLPLQIVTGLLIWGAQRWPGLAEWAGGLTIVAPIHALAAWLFASFIVLHVYLTTTGHTPLSNLRAMITGWDEVEAHDTEEVPAP